MLEVPLPDDVPLPGLVPPATTRPPAAVPSGAASPSRPRSDTVAAHHAKADRRPADTIWRANPREQGLIGFTDAVAYFGGLGWSVSVPLIDSQPYDLIVDDGRELQRVQVKTTTYRSPYGNFIVSLATRGGNQSFHTSKDFDPTASDLLYVLTDRRERYVIPTSHVRSKTSLHLGDRMARFLQ
jgi:hypothetical protein